VHVRKQLGVRLEGEIQRRDLEVDLAFGVRGVVAVCAIRVQKGADIPGKRLWSAEGGERDVGEADAGEERAEGVQGWEKAHDCGSVAGGPALWRRSGRALKAF
jgi:hypothetical protein